MEANEYDDIIDSVRVAIANNSNMNIKTLRLIFV
ncbi:hypothetical protein SAMN05216326_1443 [Nitrosomonas marina]|uniref:Uncharacterized protein n=1 Tax=Nitrosomonas marina TaxID=917 RepID=A0A1I0FTX0_9PROT|nr:hypothetical protein SAMN05216326_1443 [Nitrosomonas marina]